MKGVCDESQVMVGVVLLSCLDFSSTGGSVLGKDYFLLSIIVRQSGLVKISIFS